MNQKGGSGKTTMSIHMAAASLVRGRARMLLIDADRQGTAIDWSAHRQGDAAFPAIDLPRPVLHCEGPTLADAYDHVIINRPPRFADVTRPATMASDVVIIPV